MMVPTSPAKLIEVKIDSLVSPFVEEEENKGKWKFVKIFSCCSSSNNEEIDPVYYGESFGIEQGPFRPTQSCDQLVSPPPTPMAMSPDGSTEGKCLKDSVNRYGNVYDSCDESRDIQLVMVQKQADALKQKVDRLQRENSELRSILTRGETNK